MSDVFIARQPVYDRKLDVFGYELLYRCSAVNLAGNLAEDKATANVVLNAFVEMDLERLVGHHRAFINFPESLLLSALPLELPKKTVILEILEGIAATPQILDAIHRLSQRGFLIALDDFVYDLSRQPLVELADIIKFDLLALDPEELKRQVGYVCGQNVKLAADKVETAEHFELSRELGFDYFQGYHFCKPQVIRGRRLPEDRVIVLRLLAKLQDPNVEVDSLEAIVCHDVSLSYKLMRLINSAYYCRRHRIHSVRHAIAYLGNSTIKSWLTLIAMAAVEQTPRELTSIATVRARMCELLAKARRRKPTEAYFTAGLFSMMDALLGIPMLEILEALPLDGDLQDALIHREGPYGQELACTVAYERGDWDDPACRLVPPNVLRGIYMSATCWADRIHEELAQAA
jgi:EAL and modified HD-GYP domain-containing signal transduction protein